MKLTATEREQIEKQRVRDRAREAKLAKARREIEECVALLSDDTQVELAETLMRDRRLREESERYWESVKGKKCEGRNCRELADQDTLPVKYCERCWGLYGLD